MRDDGAATRWRGRGVRPGPRSAAPDLQPDGLVDGHSVRIGIAAVGLPDLVHVPIGRQIERVETEPQRLARPGGRPGERVEPQRRAQWRVPGGVHRPFQARDIGQVRVVRDGGEGRQEVAEPAAILEQARPIGQVAGDELRGGEVEEASVNQPDDGGIGCGERLGQGDEGVVAIDLDALRRGEAVADDGLLQAGGIAAGDGLDERSLQIKQRGHGGPP